MARQYENGSNLESFLFRRIASMAVTAGLALLLPGIACADTVPAPRPGTSSEFRLVSMRELRDAGVVRQRYDYSCGSAALATLLTYGLDDPVREEALLNVLLEPLRTDERALLRKKGLTLQDLQDLARRRGHKAQGFRIERDQLRKLPRPVIVFVQPGGYPHFAVLKGIRGDRAYLADPSIGNVRMPLYRFLDMWQDAAGEGIIFAVERQDGTWPGRYPLQLADATTPAPEAVSARRLIESGRPYPSLAPQR